MQDDEAELLERFRAGDSLAAGTLFERSQPTMFGKIGRFGHKAVDGVETRSDFVQDAMFIALRHRKSCRARTIAEWRAWVLAILGRETLRRLKLPLTQKRGGGRRRSATTDSGGEIAFRDERAQTASDVAIEKELESLFLQFVAQPAQTGVEGYLEDHLLLLERLKPGMTNARIALEQHLSEATVARRVNRAWSRLRQQLVDKGYTLPTHLPHHQEVNER